mmetsp:Transcript_52110/g.158269  ORF Transcript_52110/g.158269 Transcript_52110/m.158269 type:complete len:214 (-) Transcript_52110:479-1120(-)
MEEHRQTSFRVGRGPDAAREVGPRRRRAPAHARGARAADEGDLSRAIRAAEVPVPGVAPVLARAGPRDQSDDGEEALHRGFTIRRHKVQRLGDCCRQGAAVVPCRDARTLEQEPAADEERHGSLRCEGSEGGIQRPPHRSGGFAVLQGHRHDVPPLHRGGDVRGLAELRLRFHRVRRHGRAMRHRLAVGDVAANLGHLAQASFFLGEEGGCDE